MKKQCYNPELWGGIECTINRVGDKYRNQLTYSKHMDRDDDIARIAELGIRKLRYPVLWEAHQTKDENENIDWQPIAEKLDQLKKHEIDIIAGLVHHGSGPAFTNLLDPEFGVKLSRYAAKVAKKFPWINYYTPVNEPLTTARFSCLYGHWYPHHTSNKAFILSLLNQLKGVVLSMQEIRKVNPQAQLIQTEDLSYVHATRAMQYQADFENERRWLTFEILAGRVKKGHTMWNYLASADCEDLLNFFMDNPCPPDILGLNYYVTSERQIDERIDRYPHVKPGTNGQHTYVDVAAVRFKKPKGIRKLVSEAWERFQIPPALTEVHIHCTREEQLRWFKEAWDQCRKLKADGVPVQAITAWSLFGAFDWNSLLTREDHVYESGVFELNNDRLRPTALAAFIKNISEQGEADSPLLTQQGWWHKSYPYRGKRKKESECAPLLIFGASGTLGTAFINICERRSIITKGITREEADITQKSDIERVINQYKPWAIINATGYVRVDEAETDIEKCYQINAAAPESFAQLCKKYGIQLVSFSSDLVFDGNKNSPYTEDDMTSPLNIYGKSKAEGEALMVQNFRESLIVRTSAFFGPWDRYNFAYQILEDLKMRGNCTAVNNVRISPTYVPHLVDKALDLLIDREYGIYHLANEGELSWSDYAMILAKRAGFSEKAIQPCALEEMKWKAQRPQYSVIKSSKGVLMPSLDFAIEQFFNEKIN